MTPLTRRNWIQSASAAAGLLTIPSGGSLLAQTAARRNKSDSLPTPLYKSLTESQRQKVCLAVDHPKRQYTSNWWYIHPEHSIPATFTAEQQELIQKIFDSMHSPEHQDAVNKQVLIDQYGLEKNAPAAGFFGTPADENFEFIYTGHHVTRRCNGHSDKGTGFGGAPIFTATILTRPRSRVRIFMRPRITPVTRTGIWGGVSIHSCKPWMGASRRWGSSPSVVAARIPMRSYRFRPRVTARGAQN